MAANCLVSLSLVILVVPMRLSSLLAGDHQVPGPVSKRLSALRSLNHTSPSSTPSMYFYACFLVFCYGAGYTYMSLEHYILCIITRWYFPMLCIAARSIILFLKGEEKPFPYA